MKQWMYILVFGLTMSACTNSEQTGVRISVLEDFTETDFIAKPNADVFRTKFGLENDPWQSANFRYGAISSLIHNKRMQTGLSGGTALLGNQLERDAEIAKFYADIDTVLTSIKQTNKHQYSSIWKPIVEELQYLQKDTMNVTTLYVYSDLQENNGNWFSVHRYEDLRLLQSNPNKVQELFLQQASGVRSSSNVKMVVVYQPQTMKQDSMFSQMRQVYTAVFKQLGISIEFVSHLN